MKINLAVLLIALSSTTFAQSATPRTSYLAQRACAGDSSAEEAIGDQASTEELRQMMNDPECHDHVGARFFLAKRGDAKALHFFACRSVANSIDVIGELLRDDLPKIGGEFAIMAYRQLLDSDARLQADFARAQANCSDCLLTRVSDRIPTMLHALLPDAPIPYMSPLQAEINPQSLQEIKSQWRLWIDSHQAELMKFRPTSDGIDFNTIDCSDVPDLSSLDHRLKAIAGEHALTCGPDLYDTGVTAATNKRIRKAVANKKAFSAYYVLGGGHVSDVAVGVAGNSNGDFFVVTFDDAGPNHAGLGNDIQVLDNGATVVIPCPHPLKLKEAFSGNLTCLTNKDSLLLSPK